MKRINLPLDDQTKRLKQEQEISYIEDLHAITSAVANSTNDNSSNNHQQRQQAEMDHLEKSNSNNDSVTASSCSEIDEHELTKTSRLWLSPVVSTQRKHPRVGESFQATVLPLLGSSDSINESSAPQSNENNSILMNSQ